MSALALGLLALAVHEAGHAAMIGALGRRPWVAVDRHGIGTAWNATGSSGTARAAVALAGPAASLALAPGLWATGLHSGALVSLALGLLNLLPFPSSDGRHAYDAVREGFTWDKRDDDERSK